MAVADELSKGIAGADNSVLKQIESSGVTVTSLSPQQRAAFVQATRPVYEKWAKSIGTELVKKAEASIAIPSSANTIFRLLIR